METPIFTPENRDKIYLNDESSVYLPMKKFVEFQAKNDGFLLKFFKLCKPIICNQNFQSKQKFGGKQIIPSKRVRSRCFKPKQ